MKQKFNKIQILAGKTGKNFLSSLGVSLMAIIFGISGIMLLSEVAAQNQGNADLTIQGVPDVVEYLNTLNFFASGNYEVQTTFRASSGTRVPTLLASGTVTVGSDNFNTGSSFIGGGRENVATATNSVIVGGAKNRVEADNGLIL
jgi:hypothetical protein